MNKLLFLQIIDKISKNALFDRNMIKNVLIPIVRASQKDERTIQKFRKALKKLPDCRYCDCKHEFMKYKTDTILQYNNEKPIIGVQNIPINDDLICCISSDKTIRGNFYYGEKRYLECYSYSELNPDYDDIYV